MTRALPPFALLGLALLGCIAGCGARQDHTATLHSLHEAMSAEVTDAEVLERHNRLAEDVVNGGALDGMFQRDVVAAIGRGQECGGRVICAEHDFRAADWVYDVGHAPGDPGLPAGPTLIVGFDHTGRVDRTFFLTRR